MELLDEILVNKFSELIPQYKYLRPVDFLPDIGFQILETLEVAYTTPHIFYSSYYKSRIQFNGTDENKISITRNNEIVI